MIPLESEDPETTTLILASLYPEIALMDLLHFFAESCDITRGFYHSLAAVMMLIEFIAKVTEHPKIRIFARGRWRSLHQRTLDIRCRHYRFN